MLYTSRVIIYRKFAISGENSWKVWPHFFNRKNEATLAGGVGGGQENWSNFFRNFPKFAGGFVDVLSFPSSAQNKEYLIRRYF